MPQNGRLCYASEAFTRSGVSGARRMRTPVASNTALAIAAAIANAVFDATGVRIRRAPFTPERVRASMA